MWQNPESSLRVGKGCPNLFSYNDLSNAPGSPMARGSGNSHYRRLLPSCAWEAPGGEGLVNAEAASPTPGALGGAKVRRRVQAAAP